MEKCFIFCHKTQSTISETYRNYMPMRITHWFEVYHTEYTKRLIKGIIRMVTKAYESHQLLRDLRCQNSMVKKHGFFIHLHHFYSTIRNYQQYRFAKTRLSFNFYANISCKNDLNNFLLLNTNPPLMLPLTLSSGYG